MERNILDLSPNCDLIIDIDMIWAADIEHKGDEHNVRIFPQGTSDQYLLECGNEETAKAVLNLFRERMKK